MQNKKEFLRPVEVKLNRAKIQVNEIFSFLETSVQENKIKFSCREFENKFGYYLYVGDYTNENFLEEVGILIGEYLHNLRSVLDNLIYALARIQKDPPANPVKLSFPIYKDQNIFNKSTTEIFNQIPIAARETIISVQPFMFNHIEGFKSESFVLSIISNLNNIDKHRIPISPIAIFEELKINGRIFIQDKDYFEINDNHKFETQLPISPNLKFYEFRTEEQIEDIDLEFKLSYQIAIEVFDEILHIDYLKNLLKSTEILVKHFRVHFN